MTNLRDIPTSHLKPNPKNPRKHLDDKKLQELAASIKQKGVIEPIIVRPAGKGFEIVAGERRYRASKLAGLDKIPAIVRELTDDEAYDFMLVENLQREDLTEREEAESFKAYVGRHKEDGIPALAEKTGISPAYIRARVRVLGLPAKVLKAWDEGKLVFGHLQQLLRVSRTKKEAFDRTVRWLMDDKWEGIRPVRELASYINDEAPAFAGAFFKTAETCKACSANSAVQQDLFGLEPEKGARCMNPSCFKKHQAEFLMKNWKTTEAGLSAKTNAAMFREDVRDEGGRRTVNDFYEGAWSGHKHGKKCLECPDFVTIMEVSGKVYHERSCAGDEACYKATTRTKSEKGEAAAKRDPEAPRASWHGVYFKDKFFRSRLAGLLAEEAAKPGAERTAKLCLYALLKSHREARKAVGAALGMKSRDEWKVPGEKLDLAVINTMTKEDILRNAILAVKAVMLEGMVEMGGGFSDIGAGGCERQLVGAFLGIDLAKEYAVDKDYLEKKTKAEILAFGKKFKLFTKAPAEAEALAKKMHLKPRVALKDPATLKKGELVALVLAHGKALVGKVPAEILK